MMEKFEIQRKIFTIDALLMLVSVLSMSVIIPFILKDTSPGSIPKQAAIATLVAMSLHLLLLLAFLYGIRLSKRKRHINKEINLVAGFVLLIFGFIVMDGAFAFWDDLLFVSIGMFLCVFCDFAVTVLSVAALFLLKSKKKK